MVTGINEGSRELISEESRELINSIIESAYRQAFIAVSEQTKLPLPAFTKGLLGDPDVFLQRIIPIDTPEAESERRRAVGLRIKSLRKKIGLTQAEVAQKLGIAPQSVTNYESGKTDPSIRNLIALSAVLETSIDYLLGRSVHSAC